MARNSEKAQSMLFRFREAQAASLGLSSSSSTLRRPRLASSVTSLKECEKWRGDVLREISRKVSKIQDPGLTDYEVRDLNDEINKLLREKGHWENQILALGGANYKRGVPSMLGGEVGAGRGGYKYFGRAKDLPGVKEMISGKREGDGREREDRWEKFRNLPSSYYGDDDEDDGVLLEEERRAEEMEWNERYRQLLRGLKQDLRHRDGEESEDEDDEDLEGMEVPPIPRPAPKPYKDSLQALSASYSAQYPAPEALEEEGVNGKRAANEPDGSTGKKQKGEDGQAIAAPQAETPTAVGYSIFSAEDLAHPTVPDRAAVEKMILQAKKRQLRQEYIGS